MKLPNSLVSVIHRVPMSRDTREKMKDMLVSLNESRQMLREKLGITNTKKFLAKVYLSSPHKIQYLLAKLGVRMVVNKKKHELEEMIRH